MGIPVINTVEQVPGARVIPIPMKMPPTIALMMTSLSFGNRRINSFDSIEETSDPTIIPILMMNAKRNAVSAPSFPRTPIIGRKLLPPIQNFPIKKYINILRTAKQLAQNK